MLKILAQRLNKNQLFIDFSGDDYCTYFALRDLGMKDIPVYMNKDSFLLANTLGILA